MHLLTQSEGWMLLLGFGTVMTSLVLWQTKRGVGSETFLVADRKVPTWQAALSIAVAWIWAPAIFICSQQSYNLGLPGIFWFTAPNILCFFLYAPLALRMRRMMPDGYTMPEYIYERFGGSKRTHIAFLTVFFGYQLGAIIINPLAGGLLLHAVSGVNVRLAICSISVIALCYTMMSGLKASIFTDVIQMFLVLLFCAILVPWSLWEVGGFSVVNRGLGGVTGDHRNLFEPWTAFAMGIPMTLSLLAGPINDQVFWQRAFAVKEKNVIRTFVFGGLFFGLVPILLSLLGFIGAALVQQGVLSVADPQLVGPTVIGFLLPKIALYAFCIMAFAGLCSTMDSTLCAVSSLGGIDIYKRYFRPDATNRQLLTASRALMFAFTIAGTSMALLLPKLLWPFLIYGALASAGMVPAILAICSKRLTADTAFYAVSISIAIGLPYSLYANISESPYHIVAASLLSVVTGSVICAAGMWRKNAKSFTNEQASFGNALAPEIR